MTRPVGPGGARPRSARLVALFLAGVTAWTAPFVHVVSVPATFAGFPWAFVYLFSTWALLIALVAWALRSTRED